MHEKGKYKGTTKHKEIVRNTYINQFMFPYTTLVNDLTFSTINTLLTLKYGTLEIEKMIFSK